MSENLPSQWAHIEIGAIGSLSRGRGGTKADEQEGGIGCIRYGDLYTHYENIIRRCHSFISPRRLSAYTPLKCGDVVFAASGETFEDIGKAAAYCSLDAACAGPDTIVFRPTGGVHAPFLGYTVNGRKAIEHKSRAGQGISVIHISVAQLARLPLDLPPIIEQRRIAEILSTLDDAIEQTEALIAKYQQIKVGLMHDLFTRGVTPDGRLRPTRAEAPQLYKESPLGWIPREWKVLPVEELCSDIVDCPHSTPTYVNSGVPCIRTADMEPGRLLLEQALRVSPRDYQERVSRMVPQEGDVIYSREGERLGIASPVGSERVCLGQRVMLLRAARETNPNFLLWAMNTSGFYRSVVSGLGATTSPHINVGDIRKALLVRPPKVEQEAIGQTLAAESVVLQTQDDRLAKLKQIKHGLMHDLLTGRVRVTAAERGAA